MEPVRENEISDAIEKLSKEQLLYVLKIILAFEPVDKRKVRNLVVYGAQDVHNGGLRQYQTGDYGQVRADKQYKG